MKVRRNIFQYIRQSLLCKSLFFALALHLFNISVDFAHSRNEKEDLSINEIESFAELIVEDIIDIGDFFEEKAETDTEPTHKGVSLVSYIVSNPLRMESYNADEIITHHPVFSISFSSAHFSILTPPPQYG